VASDFDSPGVSTAPPALVQSIPSFPQWLGKIDTLPVQFSSLGL
jgi:hypothetical protein